MIDFNELRKLALEATRGEWHQETECDCPWNIVDDSGVQVAITQQRTSVKDNIKQTDRTANAAFIAAANPQTICNMIDLIDAQAETLFKKYAEIAELKISGKNAGKQHGRYIYHYCAAIGGNSTFSGIAQMENRIISQVDLEYLKNLVSTSEYTANAILSLSYLGREFEESA